MNVLSCFDGMSCGQLALSRAGVSYDNYFASELDKYAIKVTQCNFPETVQLGDVQEVRPEKLPKIDLLIGGSPCQGFSFAGKQLNFDDPRSKLFFEFVRLKNELKPKYFLLENVRMKKESQDIISEYLGVEPVFINSSLVSAQNRQRLYWTNIPFEVPEDRQIVLMDILEDGFVDRDKSHCLDANYFKGGNLKSYFEKNRRQLVFDKPFQINPSKDASGRQPYMQDRVFDVRGKSHALTASFADRTKVGSKVMDKLRGDNSSWRKLTPVECERLQTVPEGYTNHVSDTQRYKMLGNGWTVDVIAHIFGGML